MTLAALIAAYHEPDEPGGGLRATLPLTGATWDVNDETGQVTPDERAAERARNCRL